MVPSGHCGRRHHKEPAGHNEQQSVGAGDTGAKGSIQSEAIKKRGNGEMRNARPEA